jgi:hypothetical protein
MALPQHRSGGKAMAMKCEVCGNSYDKSFSVIMGDKTHHFDCFECAVHLLAPVCSHCGVRILGHGAEVRGRYFCSAHCAKETGAAQIHDRD